MSQETRLVSNRAQVLSLVKKAREDLARANRRLTRAEDILGALGEARTKLKTARALAEAKPTPRARRLPARIRRAVESALKALERAEGRIRSTPVTAEERLLKQAGHHVGRRAALVTLERSKT